MEKHLLALEICQNADSSSESEDKDSPNKQS